MARDKRKKRERFKVVDTPKPIGPTPEQSHAFQMERVTEKRDGGGTINLGEVPRRVPMIDILRRNGTFSEEQYRALKHYRHHALIIEKSPTSDSLNKERHGGSGNGPTIEIVNASQVTAKCESAAGSVRDILKAVVIDDQSLTRWAMEKFGAFEERDGKVVRMKPRRKALDIAKQNIVVAAQRVQAELDA